MKIGSEAAKAAGAIDPGAGRVMDRVALLLRALDWADARPSGWCGDAADAATFRVLVAAAAAQGVTDAGEMCALLGGEPPAQLRQCEPDVAHSPVLAGERLSAALEAIGWALGKLERVSTDDAVYLGALARAVTMRGDYYAGIVRAAAAGSRNAR